MSVHVWKRIVRIQREFLWGGVGGGKEISWVKGKSVCQAKKNGGIGIIDIQLMNASLLAKWRWRLLDGETALWMEVLGEKYDICNGSMLEGVRYTWPRFASVWWKDVVKLDVLGTQGWFVEEIERKVGNGLKTSFWNDKWCGGRSFSLKYPRLYSISTQKEVMVGELGAVMEGGWDWNFTWRRRLFVWEEELFTSLLEDLDGTRWLNVEDRWTWKLEDNGIYSMKSVYLKLEGVVLHEDVWGVEEKQVFENTWKSPTPTKVIAFSWMVLNRVPTRDNLALRNALPPKVSSLCALCNLKEEPVTHIFLHCDVASLVWTSLMKWFDCCFLIPPNLFVHWECWSVGGSANKVTKGLWLVWHTTIWVLWSKRNDKIFKGLRCEVDVLIEEIKVLFWRCLLERSSTLSCLFYEWCWNPMLCLER